MYLGAWQVFIFWLCNVYIYLIYFFLIFHTMHCTHLLVPMVWLKKNNQITHENKKDIVKSTLAKILKFFYNRRNQNTVLLDFNVL